MVSKVSAHVKCITSHPKPISPSTTGNSQIMTSSLVLNTITTKRGTKEQQFQMKIGFASGRFSKQIHLCFIESVKLLELSFSGNWVTRELALYPMYRKDFFKEFSIFQHRSSARFLFECRYNHSRSNRDDFHHLGLFSVCCGVCCLNVHFHVYLLVSIDYCNGDLEGRRSSTHCDDAVDRLDTWNVHYAVGVLGGWRLGVVFDDDNDSSRTVCTLS